MKEAFKKVKDFLKSKFDYCAEQAGMNLDAECGSEIASYFRERKELYLDRANIYGEVMREVEKVEAEFENDACEWRWGIDRAMVQCKGDYIIFESRRLFSFCPYCGKKIKEAE